MRSFETWIGRASAVLAALVLLATMLQIVVDVVMRGVFGTGLPATSDIVSRYYMVAISFLPLALTEIHNRHIEATIFTDLMGPRARRPVAFLGIVLGLAVFGLMTWGTASEALLQTRRDAYVEVGTIVFPTWPSYWILPLSFGLMCVILMTRLFQLLSGRLSLAAHDPAAELPQQMDTQ